MGKRLTTEEFIKRAKEVHGGRYDYSSCVFTRATEKLTVTCREHGDFEITASKHYNAGQGCPKCSGQSMDLETFASDMAPIHGGRYEYISLGRKVSPSGKKVSTVTMRCGSHGEFTQARSHHRNGTGCPECQKEKKTTTEFVAACRDIHGDMYTYEAVRYEHHNKKVPITCPLHGTFLQTPSHHRKGHGCPKCHSYTGRTIVYLVHIESHGEEMLKIGITNHDVGQRFNDAKYPDQHATEIATLEFKERADAQTIEAYLHAKYKHHQFTPKVKFAGHTECFNIEALELIKPDFGV